MTTTMQLDEVSDKKIDNPGARLAQIRETKGYSLEYVAGKLHLRVRIIELLETDSYDQMPEPVFVKGYFRAYAKLLEVPPEPYLELFNSLYAVERKTEKALWQSKRESHRREKVVRLVTAMIVVSAIITVGLWWHSNADSPLFVTDPSTKPDLAASKNNKKADDQLSEVSKIQSLFQFSSDSTLAESKVG